MNEKVFSVGSDAALPKNFKKFNFVVEMKMKKNQMRLREKEEVVKN
jgi:rRNA pseudouridine-1189 N-methylase Emg1 (Nep1/Mra1 family)